MDNKGKTTDKLTHEIAALRRRIAQLERDAADHGKISGTTQNSDHRFCRLFENAKNGTVFFSMDTGTIIDVNAAFLSLSGISRDDILGKRFWEISPLKNSDAARDIFNELQRQDNIFYDDMPFEARNGRRIAVEMACSVYDLGSGNIAQCVVRDITRRKPLEKQRGRAESRFQALFREAAVGIAIVDASGRVTENNPKLENMLGYGKQELIARHFTEFTHPEDLPSDAARYKDLLENKIASYQMEVRCIRKDGAILWGLLAVSLIHDRGGAPLFAIRMIEDITDRKRAEESLVESRNFYLSLIDELPNPIRRADTDGKCTYFNKAWFAFTGRTMEQEIGEAWTESVHAEDRDRLMALQSNSFKTRSAYVTEYRLRYYNGDFHWVVEFGNPFNEMDGSYGGHVSSCYDVQDRKAFEERLQVMSTTDELTGLLNRRGFFTLAQQQVKLANRNNSKLLLFYMDLDGLKQINDTYGHPEGDLALAEAASVFREIFRESDIIGRLGGDEFAVLLFENISSSDEHAILIRLHETLRVRNAGPGRRYTLSLSIGIKSYDPAKPCSLDELISRADTLMFEEKRAKYRTRQ